MADDRTSEFLSLVRSMPSSSTTGSSKSSRLTTSTANNNNKKNNTSSSSSNDELRNFHTTAALISRDIASTSALLNELTQLVRNQSAFDSEGNSIQINPLVIRIKTSIENLNGRIDDAQRIILQQKRRLGQDSQAGQEAANMVEGLKTVFAEAASDFKKVLQHRTDTMKHTSTFQRQVYGEDTGEGGSMYDDDNPIPNMSSTSNMMLSAAPPPIYTSSSLSDYGNTTNSTTGFLGLDLTSSMMTTGQASGSSSTSNNMINTSSSLPRPHGIDHYSTTTPLSTSGMNQDGIRLRRTPSTDTTSTYYGSAYNSGNAPILTPLDIQRMEEESRTSLQMQLIPDQDYLLQRADAMATVESNIVELGTIFNKLAVMVHEHRELVQRVEDNVEDANMNINLSLNVLTDTLTSLRTNKMLALRLFSILVVFIMIFIIFFA